MKKQLAALGWALTFMVACTASKGAMTNTAKQTTPSVEKAVVKVDSIKVDVEEADEKEMADAEKEVIPDTLPVYRATATLTNDIIHTKLDLE